MKRFLTVMFVLFAVLAFACVSFAAPEGKIKTETAPVKQDDKGTVKGPKTKVDKTKITEPKKEEKKDPKDATKGKKVEKKEEPKKGDK